MIKTFDVIKMLEEKLHKGYGFSIFKGYKAINKYGVEKIIDDLYSNLSSDLMEARKYLKNNDMELPSNSDFGVYDSIKDFEVALNQGLSFAQYVIVNVQELEKIIDKIYKNLPKELLNAKNVEK